MSRRISSFVVCKFLRWDPLPAATARTRWSAGPAATWISRVQSPASGGRGLGGQQHLPEIRRAHDSRQAEGAFRAPVAGERRDRRHAWREWQ